MNILVKIVCSLCIFVIVGCGADKSTKVLRVGHTLETKHVVHKALVTMAANLNSYSNGELTMKIYPNGQLGSERDMVELLQIGSLAMTKVSAAALEGFVVDMKVFSIPYIFRSREHRWQVLQSEIGEDILLSLEKAHLKGLGYFDAGSRSFYTCNEMIRSPDDLMGKKIRVMNSQAAVKMVASFGGAATPISWGELYAAMQQGVVEGAENNPPSFYSSRHYEICPYYSLNEHASVPDVIVASKHVMDSLSEQQKKWLKHAMNDAVELQKSLWEQAENEALEEVIKAGVEVYYPDKKPFIEAVLPFHATFHDTLVGDYLTRISVKGELLGENNE
ncbi:TRAP transporter substrate-binding protein [Colwellia sp. 20A7]|uniref:TRAP transporter substrate-binding protein n=1 Tax=Colwellia sp. 20A7 TaxID=2689569 RepID=UPI00135ADE45|nr:TRAP transporter substrate-binding protein [Colwellia sp. 20A7]